MAAQFRLQALGVVLWLALSGGLPGAGGSAWAAPVTPAPASAAVAAGQAAPMPTTVPPSATSSATAPAAPAALPPTLPQVLTPKALAALAHEGKDEAALQALGEYLEQNGQDGSMWFLKSQVLTHLRRYDEAIKVLRLVEDRFPEMVSPYNNLAVLYAAHGQLQEARRQLVTALQLQPDYAVAQENLGDVYLALARQAYQAALKHDPYNKALKSKAGQLD